MFIWTQLFEALGTIVWMHHSRKCVCIIYVYMYIQREILIIEFFWILIKLEFRFCVKCSYSWRLIVIPFRIVSNMMCRKLYTSAQKIRKMLYQPSCAYFTSSVISHLNSLVQFANSMATWCPLVLITRVRAVEQELLWLIPDEHDSLRNK